MDASQQKSRPIVHLSLFDRAITAISPAAGLKRIRAKAVISSMNSMGFLQTGAFTGGSRSKRSMRGWQTTGGDADTDLLPDLADLRARSRDLFNNTPLATGCLNRVKTNVVGSGLRVQCRIMREFLGLDNAAADIWERDVEERFNAWAENKDCDITRTQNFYELQALALFSSLLSGDCFTLMPRKKVEGMDSTLRLSLYEADFVSNPNWAGETNEISGGVEVDEDGAPVAYHFSNYHPGNGISFVTKWEKILAFGAKTNRRQVLHLFKRDRPGQRRGAPMLSPVIESLKQLGRYSESELMAAVVQSFFTVFVTQETKNGDPIQQSIPVEQRVPSSANPADKNIYEMGNGNIIGLGENEKIQMAAPTRPNSAFDAFFTAYVRQIGSALEIPFEVIILHFTSSYSASRAALLEAWKYFRDRRQFLVRNWCQPVFEEWLYEEVINGRVLAPGFLSTNFTRYAWSKTTWQGRGQGQLDPVKEGNGLEIRLNNNVSTYEDEFAAIAEGDWTSAMVRKERETNFLKEKNLYQEPEKAGPGAPAPAPDSGGDGSEDEE